MARRKAADVGSLEAGFTFGDLVRFTDATKTNLIHWTTIRLIRPDVEDGKGTGHHKRYSVINMVEVQLAAAMNRLHIPTAVMRQGLRAFRDHHDLSTTIYEAEAVQPAQQVLTTAQQQAVIESYMRAFIRRDEAAVATTSKKLLAKARANLEREQRDGDGVFSVDHQRLMLYHAGQWRRFLVDTAFRASHFYGLFVFPDDGDATVGDEPLSLHETVTEPAILIPLAPVIGYIDDVIRSW